MKDERLLGDTDRLSALGMMCLFVGAVEITLGVIYIFIVGFITIIFH